MRELLFSSSLLLIVWTLGAPAALLLPPAEFRSRALAAPALGLGLFGLLATIGYRNGLSLRIVGLLATSAFVVGLGILARGLVANRRMIRSSYAGFVIVALPALLLLILPLWTGGQQFAAFQGNHIDQLTYLAMTVGMRRSGFRELLAEATGPIAQDDISSFAAHMLNARPSVPILFGVMLEVFDLPAVLFSYPFLVALAFLVVPTGAFLLVNLFGMRLCRATILSGALAVGFYIQYIFDINAWGQLAATPLALLAAGIALATLSHDTGSTGNIAAIGALLGLCGGAIFYLYPEIVPVFGPPLAIVAIWCLLGMKRARVVVLVGLAGSVTLALCALNWAATIGLMERQVALGSGRHVDWWVYFQRYLLGRDVDFVPIIAAGGWMPDRLSDRVYTLLSLPLDFVSGLLGFNLFLPQAGIELPLRIAWKLTLGGLCLLLFARAITSLLGKRGTPLEPRGSVFRWFCLASLVVPVAILLGGRPWAAGKALSMIGPLIFILIATTPAAGQYQRLSRVPRVLFVAGHVLLGLYRPIAALGEAGIHYRLPYPGIQDESLKREFSWDLRDLAARGTTCQSLQVHVENPFLSRFVLILLTDLGLHWSSEPPVAGAATQCLITTTVTRHYSSERVFVLARDLRLIEFLEGRLDRLELIPSAPNGIRTSGLFPLEHLVGGPVRWTNGTMEMTVPLMGGIRPAALEIGLDKVLPDAAIPFEVSVDGRPLYAGPAGEMLAVRRLPIPWEGEAAATTIAIRGPSFQALPDTRKLGLPVRWLALTR